MEKSESIAKLAEALCKFQGAMEAIKKDSTNPFFKSRYASLGAIIEDTRDPLAKNGLSYAQFPSGEYGLDTILMHTSGEWIKSNYIMKPIDQKPQSLGSALSYQRRYALCAILGLQVEDDDANTASGKSEAQKEPTVQYAPKNAPKATVAPKKTPFETAKEKISKAVTAEELATLSAQVNESVKLTTEEKADLQDSIEARASML